MIAPRLFYAYVSYSFVLRIRLYLCRSTSTKTIERLEICVLLTKLSQNHFNTFMFKIRSVCNLTIPVSEWYPMVVHECQILFDFFLTLILFIHLIYFPVLYSIHYFRFTILCIIISVVYKKNLIIS